MQRQQFTQFLSAGSVRFRRWINHVCVWTDPHWSEGEKLVEVKLTLWHSHRVRDRGWWVIGLMGLMLDIPEVQISWLLAVTISSKPLPQLLCMRGEGKSKRVGANSSSTQPEKLSSSSALSLWIHSVLVEGRPDLRSLLCALCLLNIGKLPAWLHPQNKQAACCCVLTPHFLLGLILDCLLQTVSRSHVLGMAYFMVLSRSVISKVLFLFVCLSCFFFFLDECPVAVLWGMCWIILRSEEGAMLLLIRPNALHG